MINRQNQPWSLAPGPDIDWRDGVPHSRQFGDIYFSVDDGVAESRYVFVEGSEFEDRARRCVPGNSLRVAETGFGTGLNFLLTLESWLENAAGGALHYIGIDNWPLRKPDLEMACATHPRLKPLADRLLALWPSPSRGCHRLRFDDLKVTLDLWWEDAAEALEDLASRNRRWIDLWYLDGFAPAKDGGIWSERVFAAIAALSLPAARFTTFTAAGEVRRGLTASGFMVSKRPGFGRKRECLIGDFTTEPAPTTPTLTPWDLVPPPDRAKTKPPATARVPATALVLGAGIAGVAVARSLAERGLNVQVLERRQIAGGGSSNLQGLTYTRLSRRFAPLGDFALASYEYSTRWYRGHSPAAKAKTAFAGENCGYLQVSNDLTTLEYLSQAIGAESTPAQVVDPAGASRHLGLPVAQGGIFFPDAFWLNPPSVCRSLLDHPGIDVFEALGDVTLAPAECGWRAESATGKEFIADIAVLATAFDLLEQPWTDWLPLQGIRGQTTHVSATATSQQLKAAFCHEGYLPPATDGVHCLGASYGPNDLSLDERLEDHNHNLELLATALPGLGFPQDAAEVSGHVALRCTTADYLPVAGPVPDRHAFNERYADLNKQKTRLIPEDCPVIEGLWLLGGLGSRGLTAAPLAAELIASQIVNEPPPLTRQLQQALAPARFLVRGLVRGAPL